MYFDIDLEFHDLLQFTDVDVIAHMESEEETADFPLGLDDFCIDWFYHDCEHWRMFEAEVFEFHLALSYRVDDGQSMIVYLLNEKSFL